MHLCYVALAQLTPSKSSTQLNFTPAKRRVRKDDQTVRVRMFLVALEGSTQGWHTQRFCFRTASLLLIARPMLVRGKNHCDAAAGDTFLQ